MSAESFLFIGRSGCGKGTQAKLLRDFIEAHDQEKLPMFYLETGQGFRNFIEKSGYTNGLAKKIADIGGHQPDFLAIWMWSHELVAGLTGREHLVIDGTPRSLSEAHIVDTMFQFYGFEQPFIIHLNVSRKWSEKHLLSRGRADDSTDDIKRRLDWFESDVAPAIEYFKNNPRYRFIEVDGEQPIEAVHADSMKHIEPIFFSRESHKN
ncbi:MAG TPA: nucleoside monophosphate kinase [Candidatus Paceibacterota bacterium]